MVAVRQPLEGPFLDTTISPTLGYKRNKLMENDPKYVVGAVDAATRPLADSRKVPPCRKKKMVGVARFELATPSPPD
jgi:hypothetical protein